MVGGLPSSHQHQHQQEARPWRYTSSTSSINSRAGRCKRHPHQALVGVCSVCLKERLLALALELENEGVRAHVDLAAEHHDDGAPELEYLHGLHAAGLEASQAAAEYINNARLSANANSASGQRAASSQAQLQQLYHHQLTNPYLHHTYKVHRSQFEKKANRVGASGSNRRYRSFSSSPRHISSLQGPLHQQHTLQHHTASTSSPPRSSTQPQMLHWRTSPNEVSPISLSGLNHFISTVKATQGDETEPKKKKKSTSLWSLLQKQSASSQDAGEWRDRSNRKGSVQGSPAHERGRGPASSSMREVHESICRGDASSLLSSPRMKIGATGGGYMPSSRPTVSSHSHSTSTGQLRRGGHWRSNSCIGDNHSFDTIHEEGTINGTSPSWLSSIFHKKRRTRSRSISTACNSSPDLNVVMGAASAKYGRFSVDAAASASSARHHAADKQDARFRKKYASLFDEATNPRAVKKLSAAGINTSRWLQREEEQGCHHCEEVKARRMKLASFLAAQMSHDSNEREVFGMNAGDQSVQLPARSSPGVSPGRKVAEEDMALRPGVYRVSASTKGHGGNALVHISSPPTAAVVAPACSSVANATSSSPEMAALSPIVQNSADDAEIEEKTQSLSRLHMNVHRSRSWSKSWNKALSPMLGFKGTKAASPSRIKKGAMIGDAQLGMQLTSAEELAVAPQVYSPRRQQEGVDTDSKRAPQHYSFLSKDYSAFSFYFSPLRRSRRKLAAEAGGGSGGNMSSARVNALSDQAAFSGLHTHNISSRHSVDGSCWPSTTHSRHR
ncbi:hypothetical protein GOP47_0003546 [Adiantum capillus-veneris]|uniref:Uncharacterized protein n=1 Tax=Adiantum capillus-veneris TaxID=13818 RepID=A0A9D4VCN2_ADICA|nr:hypothetical protein GOP47_0003546 [Adiantum capillus-veneris]